ncbi:MAG: hypothetical protein LBT51_01245 [Fusobacteriaceae bacterium]|jgi:hypothetical protein|nr:hypothetical protein [Fusobacteriaceae bacterium]
MIAIELNDEQFKKMEKLSKISIALCNEVLKSALKKAISKVKKIEIKEIQDHYTMDPFFIQKDIKSSVKNLEGTIMASTKKNNIYNFNLSVKKPRKSRERLKAIISKAGGLHVMRTMFWAFYKSTGQRFSLGLYKRNSSDNKNITPFKTVSTYGMAKEIPENEIEKIKDIFYKELDKRLGELLY